MWQNRGAKDQPKRVPFTATISADSFVSPDGTAELSEAAQAATDVPDVLMMDKDFGQLDAVKVAQSQNEEANMQPARDSSENQEAKEEPRQADVHFYVQTAWSAFLSALAAGDVASASSVLFGPEATTLMAPGAESVTLATEQEKTNLLKEFKASHQSLSVMVDEVEVLQEEGSKSFAALARSMYTIADAQGVEVEHGKRVELWRPSGTNGGGWHLVWSMWNDNGPVLSREEAMAAYQNDKFVHQDDPTRRVASLDSHLRNSSASLCCHLCQVAMATVTIPAAKASLAPVARSENKSAGTAKVGFASSGLAGARLTTTAPRASKKATTSARPAAPRAVIDSSGAKDVCMDPDVSQSVLGIILGGGAGTRLYPLTKKRAKPAVPLGANYRLIDIPVSNCINSNIVKIYVMTQFNSASLNRHLSRAYTSNMGGYKTQGFVEVLAAQQSPENPNWFQGTADAVRQYLWQLEEQNVQEYLILAGDHLYRMDYQRFIKCHRENDADITIAALPMDEKRAEAFGLMKIDDTGRIVEFAEKPKGEALKAMQVDTTILGLDAERAKELPYIASMGIYVISKDAMIRMLAEDFPDANDFGSEVIPGACAKGAKVQAFLYDGYWEDIGTIEAFYNANLSTTQPDSPFSFYDRSAPIYTQARYLPPSKLQSVDISESVIGEGCIIEDSQLHHSVIGLRAKIGAGSIIKDTLVMGADYYETEDQQDALLATGGVPIGIGKNVVIQKAIIDKNARIGDNVQIINKDQVEEAARETDGYFIKSGIVTVIKDAVIPPGTVI
ncbi:unnamed protein product [Closterium sp. Yama58-4]|nr:unnamed protein product [Closterium sp. Yama58-4]